MNIAGVTLSKTAAEKLAAAAMQSAQDNGYCEETVTVLRDLGFPIPEAKPVKILLEVEVHNLPFGVDAKNLSSYNFNVDLDGYEVGDSSFINDVRIKQ